MNFSEKPVEIGLAAPRTFSRNYTRSKNKKKSNKHQDSQEGTLQDIICKNALYVKMHDVSQLSKSFSNVPPHQVTS